MSLDLIINDGMPADTYQADSLQSQPSLNSSIAKILITQSPLHAWCAHPRLNPNYVAEESEDFDRGSAAHALLLEGEDRMIEVPYDDWRKNAAKDLRDEARAMGKLPMLTKHVGSIRKMVEIAKRALAECELGVTLEDFHAERTVIWKRQGVWKRARFDLQHKKRPLILDYKTTGDSSPFSFQRQIFNLSYDIQAAMYCEAYRVSNPNTSQDPTYVLLAQENEEPFACSLIGLSPMAIDFGWQRLKRATEIWKDCLESGCWPGYSTQIAWVDPPSFVLSQWEERIG